MDDSKRIEEALDRIQRYKESNLTLGGTVVGELLFDLERMLKPETIQPFKFMYFKESGKWAYAGKGMLPKSAFAYRKPHDFRVTVLQYNDGKWPGTTIKFAHDYAVLVQGFDSDEDNANAFGFPILYHAGSFSS